MSRPMLRLRVPVRAAGSRTGAYGAHMAGDVLPFPDSNAGLGWGICRACGQCLLLEDGVMPRHVSDPARAPERGPAPKELRCRGEGHPPI